MTTSTSSVPRLAIRILFTFSKLLPSSTSSCHCTTHTPTGNSRMHQAVSSGACLDTLRILVLAHIYRYPGCCHSVSKLVSGIHKGITEQPYTALQQVSMWKIPNCPNTCLTIAKSRVSALVVSNDRMHLPTATHHSSQYPHTKAQICRTQRQGEECSQVNNFPL